jgi:hypothetical protein
MIRFEILLPLFYNDGRPIEQEMFVQTDDDFVRQFGATSTDTVVVRGHWVYQSTLTLVSLVSLTVSLKAVPRLFLDHSKCQRSERDLAGLFLVGAQRVEFRARVMASAP